MDLKPLELYIHIPFCVRKCQYCDFLSFGMDERKCGDIWGCLESDQPVPDRYIETLCNEIRWYGSQEQFRCRPVISVFFGGGTPSLMSKEQMARVMGTLNEYFSIREDAEITMEANPGTVNYEKLKKMHDLGINRLSIGLQSTAENELKIMGRIHSYADFLKCFQWARDAGFKNINIDVMTAVPEQTIASYKGTLEKVTALEPEHISAYSLIIEPGTPFEMLEQEGKLVLPDEDEERDMYHLTKEFMAKAGYLRYEISNYAKPGYECRHNIGYWRRTDYLGLGLGASSLIGKERFSNTSDMQVYLKENGHPKGCVSDVEKLDIQSEMEEFMFLGLRMVEGIREDDFYRCFHHTLEEIYGEVIRKNRAQGLLEKKEGRLYLTELGLDLANTVMMDFLLS